MGGIDGFETCEKIRNLDFKNPIIFLSGNSDDSSLTRGFSVGGNDYIKKPFKYSELFARIGLHLKLRKLSKESGKRKSKEMFEAVVVAGNHHLRQPLTVISGNIDIFLMKEEKNIDKNSIVFLDRAKKSVDEAVEILDRLKEIQDPKFENYVDQTKMLKLFDSIAED